MGERESPERIIGGVVRDYYSFRQSLLEQGVEGIRDAMDEICSRRDDFYNTMGQDFDKKLLVLCGKVFANFDVLKNAPNTYRALDDFVGRMDSFMEGIDDALAGNENYEMSRDR